MSEDLSSKFQPGEILKFSRREIELILKSKVGPLTEFIPSDFTVKWINCAECNVEIRVRNKRNHINQFHLLEASACTLCSASFKYSYYHKAHYEKAHPGAEIPERENSKLSQEFHEKCFGNSPLIFRWCELEECKACGQNVPTNHKMTHVTARHFPIPLYSCSNCQLSHKTKRKMAKHAQHCGGLFLNDEEKHRAQLEKFVEVCFKDTEATATVLTYPYKELIAPRRRIDRSAQPRKLMCQICGVPVPKPELSIHRTWHLTQEEIPIEATKITGCKYENDLCFGEERRKIVQECVKQENPKGGKVRCKLCQETMVESNMNNHVVIRHLGKPLILCPLCNQTEKYKRGNMMAHIRRTHPEHPTAVPIDHRHRFNTEIRELKAQCFGVCNKPSRNTAKPKKH